MRSPQDRGDAPARGGRPGEGDLVDARVGARAAPRPAVCREEVEDAFGQPDLSQISASRSGARVRSSLERADAPVAYKTAAAL